MIKSFWIPGLTYEQIIRVCSDSVLAIWYVKGVIVLSCVVIYTSDIIKVLDHVLEFILCTSRRNRYDVS